MDTKTYRQNIAIKLDMEKEFNRVEWKYLYRVLERFGFDQRLVGLITRCIEGS